MKRFLSNLNRGVSVVLALVVVLLVNWIVLTNPVRIDLSGRQYYSLSDKTTSLLKGLEHQVDVIVFFQEEHKLYHDIENLLEEYQYHSRNIHVEWVDPARDLAQTEKLAKQYGLTEAQVVVFDVDGKSKIVEQADLADIKMVKGRKDPILSAFKGEQAFSSAIQGLVQGETPKVYFLVGHGEKRVTEFDQVSGYTRIGTALVRDNLELAELLLTGEKKIPEDAAALIIAGPDKAMSAAEVDMVEDYLRRSGRVMILLDALKDGGLEPMLRRWGVGLRNDFVLDPENTLKGSDVYVLTYYEHPITMRMGGAGARFHLPRSVEPLLAEGGTGGEDDDRPTVVQLAMTSETSWSETQVDDMSPKYDEDTGDLRGSFSLAVAVERGAPQKMLDVQILPSRMVVFGDSDFISNGALTGGDQDLFMSAMNWLLDREELMAIAPKPIEEIKLSLTRKQLGKLFWINVAGIPLVAVAGGLLVWIRRRK
ncbi:MAG: GldG family protein [Verrucomicrobia bacterium]|nr:GldG family protein [Verrucomicrobiota bacterium]